MDFRKTATLFKRFLLGVPKQSVNRNGINVGIALMPWMQTCVPWYCVALALLYRHRGFQPHLILHDTPFIDHDARELRWIESLIDQISEFLPVKRLAEVDAELLNPEEELKVSELFETNKSSYLRRGIPYDFSAEGLQRSFESFKDVASLLKGALRQVHYDHLVIPGGIYGQSGLYFALDTRCRIATFDSGLSSVVVGVDSVAAHCEDVRCWATSRDEVLVRKRQEIAKRSCKEIFLRLTGKDRYSFQNFKLKQAPAHSKCDVLIPLNLFDDAAGIGRIRNFADPREWLNCLLDFLGQHSCSVVVREHPVAVRCATDRSLFRSAAEQRRNVAGMRFIHAEEQCNTYGLLSSARVVLPVSSSVGIEAACLGIPVVMESEAYYAQAPFAHFAPSREEYLSLILKVMQSGQRLSSEQREEAQVWYYLSQVTNSLQTKFTPLPEDFRVWATAGFEQLLRNPDALLILDSLSSGDPICKLVLERSLRTAYEPFISWFRTRDWESRVLHSLNLR